MYRLEDLTVDAPANNRLTWALAGLALFVIVVGLRYLVAPPAPDLSADAPLPLAGAAPAAGPLFAAGPPAGPAELNAQQSRANAAAAQAPAAPATVLARPDYVSEMEWQVLQGLAARSSDPARELARLVAKLRFAKQLELWRGGEAALAAGLLAELPARVAAGDFDRATAQSLQAELLRQLEPDADRRRARAGAEAARLREGALQEVR